MNSNTLKKQSLPTVVPGASIPSVSLELPVKNAGKSTETEFPNKAQFSLRPRCPKPNEALSDYLCELITTRTMKELKRLCQTRNVTLDWEYWQKYTRKILEQKPDSNLIIITAPPGAGKSTWIESFLTALIQLFEEIPDFNRSLIGVAVVREKVEDLNQLAAALNENSTKNRPAMIALQGWTQSGQQQGFCDNPAVTDFSDCRASCPYSSTCSLRRFHTEAPHALIIGLTQARFDLLRSCDSLDAVLQRDVDSQRFPRRFIFFDEKPPLARIHTLDKDVLDRASQELTDLVRREIASDNQVRILQRQIDYYISRLFQQLRGDLRLQEDGKLFDCQMGFCTLGEVPPKDLVGYDRMRDEILIERKRFATRHLREALFVMDRLYAGEECLYSKANGFAITTIQPADLHTLAAQIVIFDATAKIDPDYDALPMPQWFTGLPERSQCTIVLHHWEHDGLAVSKRSLEENPWKIPAFSELVAQQLCAFTGDIFVCGYKSQAELLAGSLHAALPEKQRQHLLLMPGRSRPTVPYFGGTNGSNHYNTATAVVMLGYPHLNPREYLIYACAAYGAEQLRAEIDSIAVHDHQTRRGSVIYRLPSVQRYSQYHLASRMTQEIYRSAIRNPRFTGELILHLFCPHQDMLEILCSQLQGALLVRKHTELPSHFAVQKLAARHYAGGQTSFGRLVHFLEAWDGTSIQIAELREKLEISPAVWKDLMADYRIKALFDQYAVQRNGRGRCAKLMKSNPNCT